MLPAFKPEVATAHSAPPEAELIALAAKGDGTAFEALMRRHNQLLFRAARSILKSDADAEDAVQEAYLSAWRALGSFRAESKLSTWLVRIVRNEALGRLRRPTAQVIPLDAAMNSPEPETQAALTESSDRNPEQSLFRAQVRGMMEARIDRLPETYRAVFLLRAVEEMSVEEVAEALELPEPTVRTRFFRARAILREGLASEMDAALGDVFAFEGGRCDRTVLAVLARASSEGLSNKS